MLVLIDLDSLLVHFVFVDAVEIRFKGVKTTTVNGGDIGAGNNALKCHTTFGACCRSPNRGEFTYPNGTNVGKRSDGEPFFRNRAGRYIRLNSNQQSLGYAGTGLYGCIIPDGDDGRECCKPFTIL